MHRLATMFYISKRNFEENGINVCLYARIVAIKAISAEFVAGIAIAKLDLGHFAIPGPEATWRSRMNALSIVVGALFAAVAIIGTDQLLAQHSSSFIALGWPGMPLFLGIAAGSAWLGRVIILMMLILTWRPPGSISWSRPAQCANLRDWLSSSWNIGTPLSRQMGHRVFGLNLCLYGEMAKPAIAIQR